MDFLFKAFKSIWPPEKEEDNYAWRRAMFLTTSTIGVVLTFHILSSLSFLQPFGIYGFATTQSVKEVESSVHAVLYAVYAPQIRSKVRERCEATSADEREEVNKDLDRLLRDYEQATKKEFDLPRCEEV